MAKSDDVGKLMAAFLAEKNNGSNNGSSFIASSGLDPSSLGTVGGGNNIFLTLVYSLKVYVVPLIAAIGLCGNMLSFVVFVGTYLRRSSSSIYLAALSLADAAFLVCVLVSWAINTGVDIYAENGWCQTFVYLTYVSSFLSVWYVVSFTVERYIAVHFPLRRQDLCTTSRAKTVVVSLSGCAAILYSFGTWTSGVSVHYPGIDPVCAPLPRFMDAVSIINNMDTVITLILPFLAILVMNVRIAYKVAQFYRERKHVALRECYTSQSTCSTMRSAPISTKRKVAYTRTQVRVTKMLLSVSSIFLALNLPRHIARTYSFIMTLSSDDYTPTLTFLAWEQVFRVLYYAHFSINVFLYSAFGKNFRRALFWLGRRIKHSIVEHFARYSTNPRNFRRHDYPSSALPLRLTEHRSKRRPSEHRNMLHDINNHDKVMQFD